MVEQYFTVLPAMKNPLHYIHKYPDRSKQILGISFEQWKSLVARAKIEALQLESEKVREKIRINQPGGGRKKILSPEEEICLCIFYLRHLPTFEILGLQFEISKTAANDIFNYWLKIVRKILPCSLLEQVERDKDDEAIAREILTESELIVDSWEQGRERPGDYQEQGE
jgi:hypothetical protein